MKTLLLALLLPCYLFSQKAEEFHHAGTAAFDAGQYTEAIAFFEQAITFDTTAGGVYFQLGLAYDKLEQVEEALFCFKKAVAFTKDTTIKISASINCALLLKDDLMQYEAAYSYTSQAIDWGPQSWGAHYAHGSLLHDLGRLEEAVQYFDKAISLDPSFPYPYYDRGIINRKLERYQEAIEDHSSAIRLDPMFSKAYNNRAYVKLILEDYKGAIQDLDISIQLTQSAFSYNNRGFAKYKLGDLKGAKKDCETSLELDPTNSWAYHYLGLVYVELGKKNKACTLFHKAVELGKEEVLEDIKKMCPK